MADLFSLKGKAALIAGASKEMGSAVARMLAAHGADVAVSARSADKLETVAAAIRAMGRKSVAIAADLAKVDQIEATVQRTLDELGGLDILVNILGGSNIGAAWALRMSEDMWDDVFTLNVKAPMFLSVAAAKVMKERGGGSIVNISTSAATGAAPRLTNYGAAKAGLEQLTESLAAEWGRFKIRVNVVVSGNIYTANLRKVLRPDIEQQLIDRTPLGRIGEADDIAAAVLYFVSPAASWVTGAKLVVDGGLGNIRPFEMK
ncbi:MAG TPA: glucose 1-dehydrogenase [Candidatus Binataceae bacterium]|jgi:NAD(P)-dependent dehydrogenase (short-subunit alcohol dehydrogenase family)|nr:glucose 1-dehydrogenase [Candidatus Binataceae bacterium]